MIPNRECTSAYSKEEVVNGKWIDFCMSVAFPLTLNALVPGCCCLDAGFWWSVAIVNGSTRMKLKRNRQNYNFIVFSLTIYGCLLDLKQTCIIIFKIPAGQTAVKSHFHRFCFLLFSHTHVYKGAHPSPSRTCFCSPQPSEHRSAV